jgi:hypothetical protein
MVNQETLDHDQPQRTFDAEPSLWARFVDSHHRVNAVAWMEAVRSSGFVGTCGCGDYLQPRPPDHIGTRTDYEAGCRAGCGRVLLAPDGRVKVVKASRAVR